MYIIQKWSYSSNGFSFHIKLALNVKSLHQSLHYFLTINKIEIVSLSKYLIISNMSS